MTASDRLLRGRRLLFIGCVCLAIAGAGCSPSEPVFNETVEGVVKLDGVPVPKVRVEFVPQKGAEGGKLPGSGAFTDDKGRYRLVCDNQKPGAVVGKHSVVVLQGRPDPANGIPQQSFVIPNAYTIASQTPLKLEVTADRHTYDLDLKSRP
jgi:hypothetical protein